MTSTECLPQTIGRVIGVFVDAPKTLLDTRGAWRSSIARAPVLGPAQVETRGLGATRLPSPIMAASKLRSVSTRWPTISFGTSVTG